MSDFVCNNYGWNTTKNSCVTLMVNCISVECVHDGSSCKIMYVYDDISYGKYIYDPLVNDGGYLDMKLSHTSLYFDVFNVIDICDRNSKDVGHKLSVNKDVLTIIVCETFKGNFGGIMTRNHTFTVIMEKI